MERPLPPWTLIAGRSDDGPVNRGRFIRAEVLRKRREGRLTAAGFDEPSEEQRRANLALNVSLMEWPK